MSKFIRAEGLEKLKKELEYLKTARQREVAERLRRAIAFGDLSENFDYHDAREEQDMLQKRIAELEDEIREARVVEEKSGSDHAQIGSTVEVEVGKEKVVYTIVTAQEANPLEGKISAESPIGSALLGKKRGAKVRIQTPADSLLYKIVSIS